MMRWFCDQTWCTDYSGRRDLCVCILQSLVCSWDIDCTHVDSNDCVLTAQQPTAQPTVAAHPSYSKCSCSCRDVFITRSAAVMRESAYFAVRWFQTGDCVFVHCAVPASVPPPSAPAGLIAFCFHCIIISSSVLQKCLQHFEFLPNVIA